MTTNDQQETTEPDRSRGVFRVPERLRGMYRSVEDVRTPDVALDINGEPINRTRRRRGQITGRRVRRDQLAALTSRVAAVTPAAPRDSGDLVRRNARRDKHGLYAAFRAGDLSLDGLQAGLRSVNVSRDAALKALHEARR